MEAASQNYASAARSALAMWLSLNSEFVDLDSRLSSGRHFRCFNKLGLHHTGQSCSQETQAIEAAKARALITDMFKFICRNFSLKRK